MFLIPLPFVSYSLQDNRILRKVKKKKSIYEKLCYNIPRGHIFIQRRLNVDATSRRCIDVEATLYKLHVPAGCNDAMLTSNFQPIRLLDPGCYYKFTDSMTNSADPNQFDDRGLCKCKVYPGPGL